ncbi:hypothetical protein H4582DRAFT_1819930 [Lactarius indigo]|nr:hypothetical protein H4582DRAFT_1819930 [Lactarius indigo]
MRNGPEGGPNQVRDGKQNGLVSEAPSEVASVSTVAPVHATLGVSANQLAQSSPLPTSPLVSSFPTSGPPHEPRVGSVSADDVTSKSAPPDAHALVLLNSITRAAQELPSHIPEAEEGDDIARVVLAGGPEDSSEAWEYLDHMLNWLLGYGIGIEDVAQRVRRGPLGVRGLAQYIHGFVVDHGVTGDLLEGKIGRLLKAIELTKHHIGIDILLTRRGRHQGGQTIDPALPDASPVEDNRSQGGLTPNIVDDDSDIEYIGGFPLSTEIRARCKQHIVSAPSGKTGIGAYPFLLHIEEHMPWEFSSRCGTLLLRARKCENRGLDEHGLCKPCQALLSNMKFRKILARVEEGVNEYTPFKYHGLLSLAEIARKKERTIDLYRLRRTNDARKLIGREGAITMHRQVLLAMSSGKIPRLDRVVRVAMDRHMSVAAILDLVRKAGRGIYHPKGFSEDEDLQALLFLRLGGQRVAEIAHRMFGIPAPSTVRRRTMIPPLICSSSYPILRDLESNLKAAFDSLLPVLTEQRRYHIVLMIDEIAQEMRPRWCDQTNQILGWCREHTKGRCMDFNSIADAELLFQDMESGDVHLAHEATIGAIGILCSNPKLYSAKPFLVSGSCKKEAAEDHASLIQTALNAIKDTKALWNARVVSIASDGEAKRGKALVQLTFKRWLSSSSPIYPWLSGCALLDLHVGEDDVTCDKDWKHVAAKRPRNALLREKGLLVHGTWITPMLIQSHLLEAGHKSRHVRAVLNPNDKQDVLLAFTLLQDIWRLPRLTSGTPGRIKARDSLRVFGSMCYHFLMPYICVDLSIEDQLEYLSYAAHLALALYAHDNACSNFVPTALYIDLMIMVKNVFFCVAKAKIDTPNSDFNIILLGTDRLENLFGCLRTIVGNDANVDNYQLGSRLTGTMESMNILALHPEWDKAPRRLHLPCVSQDSSTIPDSADHISPRSWRASQALNSVTPPTVWIRGRRKLEADYPFVCNVLSAVMAIPNATILAPFGTLLVHTSTPGDEMEDLELSHDDVLHGLVPGAVMLDHTDVSATGDGVRELEDAATSLDWDPEQHAFSNVVMVDDGTSTLKKSRALSLLFKYSNSTSSTDRLRRVQQQARYVQPEPETLVDDSSEELCDILMVDNPVATLLSCEDNIFLCIGEVIGIHIGSKAVDHLRLDALLEDSIRITYQAYSLVCTIPGDNNPNNNTRAGKYDWQAQSLLPMRFKVPGNLVQPINPALAMPSSHMPAYLFETSTLIAFASSLRDRLSKPQLKLIPQTEPTDRFPYREGSGMACFVAETIYEVRELSSHECPACEPPVQLDAVNGQRVLAHIGSHVLHDPTLDKSGEPCGLCLRPANTCAIYLTKRSGRNYQWTLNYGGIVPCPNATNFSYSTAMVSSESSPCSNVPLRCPYCPDGSPAVWRYNMRPHFQLRHQGVDATKHEDLWKITAEEANAMAKIWENRHKQPKRRGKGRKKVPLKLSEAHSSRRLSGFIAREDDMIHDDELDPIEEGPSGHEAWSGSDGESEAVSIERSARPGSDSEMPDGAEDGEDGLGELEGGNERDVEDKSESATGARQVNTHLVSRPFPFASLDADKHPLFLVANIGVPVSLPTDIATCHTSSVTKHPTGTEDEGGGLLGGAQMSSFGRKRKLRNMCDVSACLCGNSAAPSAGQAAGGEVVCCRVAGCETKWYHIACVGLSFSPKSWTCEVCQSDTGMLKRRRM